MTTYLAGTGANDGDTYSFEDPTTYVRYGYWLSVVASATDDTTTINRYLSGPDGLTCRSRVRYRVRA